MPEVTMRGLRVGDSPIDLRITRLENKTHEVEVLANEKGLSVEILE